MIICLLVNGVVIDCVVDFGQMVVVSFQILVLIKIVQDFFEMCIDISFVEVDIGLICEGQKVCFIVDVFLNCSFMGDVQQICLNLINQQNVVIYNVWINVVNLELVLLLGMIVYVNIGVQKWEGVLLVLNVVLCFKLVDVVEKKVENG